MSKYQVQHWNTGGGCIVHAIELENGNVLCFTDECITLYPSEDDFFNDDGTKCLGVIWRKS